MSIYDKASLVLIPSGTKTSKVYSQKPVNGDGDFTFSRSTAATRVNADGNIEKETQNLILQSNNFDTTWYNSDTTETSGQSGYDGSSNAWLITKTTSIAYRYIGQAISTSGVQTASFYAKAGSLSRIGILVGGGDNPYVSYDLSLGTILAQRASVIDSSITDVGSGWYRCTMTYNVTISDITIYPDWDQTNTGNLYLQDVQLEQGLVARDYIETTTAAVEGGITDNVPRLDYTDSSCPALLLEPQRTNIQPYSEYFGSSFWTKNDVSLDFGYLAPDGTNSAYKITKTGSNAHLVNTTTSGNTGKIKSIWARTTSGTGTIILFNSINVYFTITEQWQRFDVAHDGADFFYACDFRNDSTLTEILIWGAQAEAGSYATSYIPTYGTSVTRNQDDPVEQTNLSTNNILNNYNSTAFIHIKNNFGTTGLTRFLALYSSAANNPRILFYSGNNGGTYNLNLQYRVTGQSDVSQSLGSFNLDDEFKFAIVINGTSITSYLNGVKKTTSTITQGNDIERLFLDDAGEMSHLLSKLLLFPTSLTDQEAIDLTTI